jgi:threonine aldolase
MARTKDRAQSGAPLTPDEIRHLRAACDRFLGGHGRVSPQAALDEMATLGDDLASDIYGKGGTVEILENEVRRLLRKPAAIFMPSGTMIQQIALRIHSDRRHSKVVAFHATSHLELHEDKAYQRLHGLVGLTIGNRYELFTLDDLQQINESLAALMIELPQREIGGLLPTWDDLVAQTQWARDHGAAVHMDGARLWECGPFYGRKLSAIAALFDTVYVSFYKGMGATTGGMLLGEKDVIAEAREWRHRHGGTLYNLWPYAASALAGVRLRLPRMPEYVKHARRVARALTALDGITVTPSPPQTPMMHIYLRTTAEAINAGIRRVARERRIWISGGSFPSEAPGLRAIELYCGDATLQLSPPEVADALRELLV